VAVPGVGVRPRAGPGTQGEGGGVAISTESPGVGPSPARMMNSEAPGVRASGASHFQLRPVLKRVQPQRPAEATPSRFTPPVFGQHRPLRVTLGTGPIASYSPRPGTQGRNPVANTCRSRMSPIMGDW
jgi:hypothetical protein